MDAPIGKMESKESLRKSKSSKINRQEADKMTQKQQDRADQILRKWILSYLRKNGGEVKATAEEMSKKFPELSKAFFKREIARLF